MKRSDIKVGEEYGAGRIQDWRTSPSRLDRIKVIDAGEWHAIDYASSWHTKYTCTLVDGTVIETPYVKPATQYDKANVVWVREIKSDGSTEITTVKTSRIKALWSEVVETSERRKRERAEALERRKTNDARQRAKDDEALSLLRALPDEVFAGLDVDVRKPLQDYETQAKFAVSRAFIARLVKQAHQAGYEAGAGDGFRLGTVDQ